MKYDEIRAFDKLNESQLKDKLFKILNDIAEYKKVTANYWGPVGNSNTKNKLEIYCKVILKKEKSLKKCPFITNWKEIHRIIKK